MRNRLNQMLITGGSLAVALLFTTGCPPTYPNCEKDEHCAEQGEVCVNQQCQQCREDANCPAGKECVSNRCEIKPECRQDDQCTGGLVCRNNKCVPECTADADCGDGSECSEQRCVALQGCNQDADCPEGRFCEDSYCVVNASRSMAMQCSINRIHFAFDQFVLDSEARSALDQDFDCLQAKLENGRGDVVIEGHADERGTVEYNLALGERRASSVRQYLVNRGLDGARLRTVSKGENEPLVDGSGEDVWSQNRRVEFITK